MPSLVGLEHVGALDGIEARRLIVEPLHHQCLPLNFLVDETNLSSLEGCSKFSDPDILPQGVSRLFLGILFLYF